MKNRLTDMKKNRWTLGAILLVLLGLLLVSDFYTQPNLYAQPNPEDTPTVELRPLSEVYADAAPMIVDLTSTYATLEFESSVPLACSVVYGTDANYGQIATDLDMAGGAHTDHAPLLTGLMPDTEYTYRVQGTAANGTMYVSEPMTFRTPAEIEADPQSEINVADLSAGALVVAVSSNFGNGPNDGNFGANAAIDGNPATAWSSNGDGDDAFIEVQLSEPSLPNAVEVWTRSMSNDTAQISEFTLTTNSGTATSETFGPFTLPDDLQTHRFEIAPARAVDTLRLDVIASSGGNTGLMELGVFVAPTIVATRTESLQLFLPFTIR